MDYLTIERTCGAAPVQYKGTIERDGVTWHFYFRSRYEHWAMAIAETFDAAVQAHVAITPTAAWYHEEAWGTEPYEASYMPYEEAEAFIAKCISLFMQGETWPAASVARPREDE